MHSLETMRRLNDEADAKATAKREANDQQVLMRLAFAAPTRIYGPQDK